MPKVLRQEEANTLYPIKKINEWMPFDPYHDYYVIRKEIQYGGSNIGLLKSIDDKTNNLYIIWLDSSFTQILEAKDNVERQEKFKLLLEDFEIIELESEEYSGSNSVDYNKGIKLRAEILQKLVNIIMEKEIKE